MDRAVVLLCPGGVTESVETAKAGDYLDALGGEVLAGEEGLEHVVEDIVIGAMAIESALGYLRRTANKTVIIGGDRLEAVLYALETSTAALILTGGLYP